MVSITFSAPVALVRFDAQHQPELLSEGVFALTDALMPPAQADRLEGLRMRIALSPEGIEATLKPEGDPARWAAIPTEVQGAIGQRLSQALRSPMAEVVLEAGSGIDAYVWPVQDLWAVCPALAPAPEVQATPASRRPKW